MVSLQKYALLGYPVKHSVSPQMQMAGFRAANINASYELIEVTPQNLGKVFEQLRQTHHGWNITVPHKHASYHLVDKHDESARVTCCVNTVRNDNGTLIGYSTDGFGMEASLQEEFQLPVKGNYFTFIGAGGATQSVALHFASQNAQQIDIINRSYHKALLTSQAIQKLGCLSQAYSTTDDFSQSLQKASVIIQGTSLGLKTDDHTPISLQKIPHNKIVVDMIYKPTIFLKLAKKNNCQTTNGFGMLLYQGAKAWEIWTGQVAPIDAMRQALLRI